MEEEISEALSRWPEHSDILAGTISQDDWNEISGAVGSLERIHQRARSAKPGEKIKQDDRDFLAGFEETMWSAAFTCSMIGTVGIRRRRPLRRLWVRVRGRDKLLEEAEEVVRYSYAVQGIEPPDPDKPQQTE